MISKIYSASGVSLSCLLEKLQKDLMNDLGNTDFLFFAIHPDFEIELVNKKIKEYFHTDKFLAFHAVDSFYNYEIIEKGIVLCGIQMQGQGKVNTFYIEDIETENTLEKTASYLNTHKDNFHIFLAGVCGGNIANFIEDLSPLLSYESLDNIVGGVSSGNLEASELNTFQFIDGKVIKNGFVLVSFENVEYSMGVSLGFQPYGITYEVQKAKGTKLYTVDDGKSVSYMATKMLENVGVEDSRYLWYVPFSVLNREKGYVKSLRTIANVKDEYIELFAPIKEGEFFKLSFATPEDLVEEDKRTARRVIKKLPNPEISFNFSCIARQYVLEDKQTQESKMYMDVFRSNLFGFFTFGEIGPDKMYKSLTFYNETSLVVTMREK